MFNYKYFDIDKFDVTELSDSSPMRFGNATYDGEPFAMFSGVMKITSYGIPQFHSDYFPNDNQRCYLKLGLDPLQTPCVLLQQMFEQIDTFMASETTKRKLFGAKFGHYTYVQCVKEIVRDEDEIDLEI